MSREFSNRPRMTILHDIADGDRRMLLSVIVPCLNEAEALRDTNAQLVSALGQIPADFEVVYMVHASTEQTLNILRELQSHDKRIRAVRFSRNLGHQMAITAGLEHAAGDAIVIIDADLHDPPAVIAEFVQKWADGYG